METLSSMVFVVLGVPHALAPCPWSHGGTWHWDKGVPWVSEDAENQESPRQCDF